jgi:photosystem I P700 chlorophyll a apoprotein A1
LPSAHLGYKSSSLFFHHAAILLGVASILWSGHLVHVSIPISALLLSGVDIAALPSASELLSFKAFSALFPTFASASPLSFDWAIFPFSLASNTVDPRTGSLALRLVACHHLYVGIFLILVTILLMVVVRLNSTYLPTVGTLSHFSLAVSLAFTGSLSATFSQHLYLMNPYPFLSTDYPSVLSLYTHHMWIAGFLLVGAFSHASISCLRDYSPSHQSFASSPSVSSVLAHRDILIGHLTWVCIFLGLHSFGIYIHNDTMQSLSRGSDTFSDTSLSLRPIFPTLLLSDNLALLGSSSNSLQGRLVATLPELSTPDFMVHHIHAFTIHVTVLILLKGLLYARSSRLVADKHLSGFRYPCDGPGRGGSCQISPYDSAFLALFWMYNSISVVLFHFSWKAQSDLWGSLSSSSVTHLTGGDFSSSAITINAWLTNFLWSQSSQVLQTYGTSSAGYGLLFLAGHFLWAFSLMFLFSGRGYWQELIESILWSHSKLHITPSLSPRALSISQGRSVGLSHYLFGGILVTWSFFTSRLIVLTT